ncbi:bZIP transcription factor 11-like [Phoenix dactylifera]|uniref:BZIP transcription factor 11-like n=1 Tax=Phoenix dactylifera TaxID=42345 RepID=A0A8B8J619_PHODC|nr:bZIP transcription factor 11-like [Phoenix dactylifera]
MASSPGTSSGSSALLPVVSGTAAADQKKLKRMLSNRESARRSRVRKKKHLDDLGAQARQLRQENSRILTALNLATKRYLAVEAENSVLRTQMMELSSRLQSLDDILHLLNGGFSSSHGHQFSDGFCSPWNSTYMNQPTMASADLLQYYEIA